MQPIISVIVPVFNSEKTIEKCLDSIINQKYNHIEIIVINDCSTDNTLTILKKYKDLITLINNEKNYGPALSRNKGLKVAKGKYIGFVDADDYISLNMYKTMVSYMNDKVDLVCCSRINLKNNEQKEIINTNEATNPKEFSKTSNYVWDKLFKKEIINKYDIEFPEKYSYAEDFFFLIKYKYYANKMVILKEPLYYYNYISENSITNSYKKNLLNIIDVLEDAIVFFKSENAFSIYEEELLDLSIGFYTRRIREFKKYDSLSLQKEFVKKFLAYFKKYFKNYKKKINYFNSNKNKFYRSNYYLMLLFIRIQQRRK